MTPTICCRDREGGHLWSRVARVLNCLHQKYNDQDQRRWKLSGCPQVTSVWTITSLSNLELVRIRAVWSCSTGMILVQIRTVWPEWQQSRSELSAPVQPAWKWSGIRTFCHSACPAWKWSGSELSAPVQPAWNWSGSELSAPVQPTWNWSRSELSAPVQPAWNWSGSELSAPVQPAWKRSGSELSTILPAQHGTEQDQNFCPCPTRMETIWIRTFCHSACPAWNWAGSELSAPVQPAWKRSGSELSAILPAQHGTEQDQNFLPLSNPHGNDLDQNCLTSMELIWIRTFCPCPTHMELIWIRIVCPCLTSMELIRIRTFCPCPTCMETIRIRTFCPCLTRSMTTEHLLQECLLVLALHDTDCFQCHFWLVKAGGEEAFQQSGTSERPAQCAAAAVCKELGS